MDGLIYVIEVDGNGGVNLAGYSETDFIQYLGSIYEGMGKEPSLVDHIPKPSNSILAPGNLSSKELLAIRGEIIRTAVINVRRAEKL